MFLLCYKDDWKYPDEILTKNNLNYVEPIFRPK